ncbi:cytochrome P450 [Schizophyllum commune H4-8]|nr:cytochrome P450 [Schizophyllum commune H4-8]KAI5899995.1 cytochrome P450 [Schizophyllum commune H4-8]
MLDWTQVTPAFLGRDAVIASILVASLSGLYLRKRSRNALGLPYPPGPEPSPIPFLGNLPDMPSSEEWHTFTEWGKQYGPLVMISILGKKMCIINTAKAATDLLDQRSSIYSDRPSMPMVCDLMGWDFNMGLQPYTPAYTTARKLFHFGFNNRASEQYIPIQTVRSTQNPVIVVSSFIARDHLGSRQAAQEPGAVRRDSAIDDEFVRVAEEAQLAMVSAARPGAYLVDIFPILKYVPEWFPGARFKRVAREGYELAQELQEKPWAWAQDQFAKGEAKPSFFTALLAAKGSFSKDATEEEKMMKKSCAVMYATAADTILASLLNFVLAMLHAPEVQIKAREELDRVVGAARLATIADRKDLPYIDAIVKETYRWEQVIPLGVPHRVMQDDVYDGYFIPEGTTMIPNQWGIAHDESMYPDAMSYRPERFIGVPDAKDGGPRNPNTIAFGWGRRICPGRFMAENQLWLHVATTLQCFNIDPAVDDNGMPVIPPRTYTSGMASRPLPFTCKITPRSAAYASLIEQNIAYQE